MVFARKRRNFEICIDYRKLNAVTAGIRSHSHERMRSPTLLWMLKHFPLATQIVAIGRLEWALATVRKQHLLLTMGYTNSLLCHSF